GESGGKLARRGPRPSLPASAGALLAPSGRAWFERPRPRERTKALFAVWSAKEASSKLIGRGLTMPFSAISLASPGTDASRVSVMHPAAREAACFVRRLPLDPGYSGALAVESTGPTLEGAELTSAGRADSGRQATRRAP